MSHAKVRKECNHEPKEVREEDTNLNAALPWISMIKEFINSGDAEAYFNNEAALSDLANFDGGIHPSDKVVDIKEVGLQFKSSSEVLLSLVLYLLAQSNLNRRHLLQSLIIQAGIDLSVDDFYQNGRVARFVEFIYRRNLLVRLPNIYNQCIVMQKATTHMQKVIADLQERVRALEQDKAELKLKIQAMKNQEEVDYEVKDVYHKVKELQEQQGVTIKQACAALNVSTRSFYISKSNHEAELQAANGENGILNTCNLSMEEARFVAISVCMDNLRGLSIDSACNKLKAGGVSFATSGTVKHILASAGVSDFNNRPEPLSVQKENELWSWESFDLKHSQDDHCFTAHVILDLGTNQIVHSDVFDKSDDSRSVDFLTSAFNKQKIGRNSALTLLVESKDLPENAAKFVSSKGIGVKHTIFVLQGNEPYAKTVYDRFLSLREDRELGCVSSEENAKGKLRYLVNLYNKQNSD